MTGIDGLANLLRATLDRIEQQITNIAEGFRAGIDWIMYG